MPTPYDNLITRRENIAAILAAGGITDEEGNFVSFDKPSYNADGEQIDWVAYKKSLYEELRDINDTLASLGGAWEEVVEGLP